MIRTKGALYEYMLANPSLRLEHHRGTRENNWWWLRPTPTSSETIDVSGVAANALIRQGLVARCDSFTFRSSVYQLVQK